MTHISKEPPELLPCPFCGGDAGDTYYQLGWFISCKHCSTSTEVTNAKARAVEAWNRRAPAVPVPQFNHTAKRKLNILLGAGEEITGYAFQNKDGRRGSIDCHGFVAWWHDAAAPQPPEAALVPSIAVTPDMVEAANEAYCPFGDMELALCAALQVAPIAPGAAPVPQGWKLVPISPTQEQLRAGYWSGAGEIRLHEEWARKESYERMVQNAPMTSLAAAPQPPASGHTERPLEMVATTDQMPEPAAWRYTDARGHYRYRGARPGFAVEYPLLKPEALYTEQQVRQLLANHGIQERST